MSKQGENIRKRTDGRWEARYEKSRLKNGKIRYGYVYGETCEEAREKRELILQDLWDRRTHTKNITMDELFEEWLKVTRYTVKESTFALYETMIRKHLAPELGRFRLRHLTTEAIQGFSVTKMKEGFSPRTIRCMLILLKNVLSYGEQMGYLSLREIQIRYPKIAEQPMHILTDRQLQQLVTWLEDHISQFNLGILLSIYSGMRVGELCGLQWGDVDFEKGVIHISKTVSRIKNIDFAAAGRGRKSRKEKQTKTVVVVTAPKSASSVRDIPVPDFLLERLLKYRGEEDTFLLTGNHLGMEPRNVQRRFQTILKHCELPDINIHSLRHAFASRCTEMGFDYKALSEILGHSSVKITMDIYVHSSMKQKKNYINQLNY